MKTHIILFPALGGVLLLAGCAGVSSEFGCNATTSDSCMTMEQANEKAKSLEEGSEAKPAAAALPRLAEGDFAAVGRDTGPVPVSGGSTSRLLPRQGAASPAPAVPASPAIAAPASIVTTVSTCTLPRCAGVGSTRPARQAEQTAQLWIAPWIDSQDVYHQPGKVLFVVKPAVWGKPQSVY
ncbi:MULTISPECIES: type IV conjugative transfer system lipoprotein TraV [Serratia]|uniref:type IV conjugative transfer system lipoprotein TraV n=1 Tax=Serratia TaxID=613 RepID=UPI0008A93FCC|nr:type IV conjugative transfer system lipoprotein TraV [Serratia marcescens]APS37001.1 conjugal transfer protein TraV [Serratia marcescens]OHT38091.1 type IV conjugative transfer system protein TraV [Serratia marcescens]OHT40355.1 type IV conjugative transfer system protein TraV [Serratia marcescens]